MSDEPTAATVIQAAPNGTAPGHEDDVDFVLDHLDQYEKEPKLKRARRVVTPFTWILVALILAAGMFALGAKMGNDHASSSSSSIPSNLASLLRNRTGTGAGGTGTGGAARTGTGTGTSGTGTARAGGGTGAGGFGGGGATIGSVKLVDGSNVYVQTTSGDVVKVTTTPGVTVNVTAPGTLADLKPGETVTVTGTPGADSTTMSATSISQVSAGGFGGGRFGG